LARIDKAFFGVIVLPVVSSSVELWPTILFTYEDTVNLATNGVVGSGMQIVLLVLPVLVILGWIMG
jgi:Ca2+:H+ antiporter